MNSKSSHKTADFARVGILARTLAAALVVILAVAGSALPTDMDQELTISFDEADVTINDGVSVVRGNVELTQGTLQLRAETMNITTQEGRIVKVVGLGSHAAPAAFSQRIEIDEPPLHGTAETITYLTNLERLELTGNAQIEQPSRRIEGGTIHWNAREGRATARSDNGGERVRMIWQPEKEPGEPADRPSEPREQ